MDKVAGWLVTGNEDGVKHARKTVRWDLRVGAKVRVTDGPGAGFEGEIVGKNNEGHYKVALPNQREGSESHGKGRHIYLLGSWWTETATKGTAAKLPIINRK